FVGIVDLGLIDRNGVLLNRFYINTRLLSNEHSLKFSVSSVLTKKESLILQTVNDYAVVMSRVIHYEIAPKEENKGVLTYIEENIIYFYAVIFVIVIAFAIIMRKREEAKPQKTGGANPE